MFGVDLVSVGPAKGVRFWFCCYRPRARAPPANREKKVRNWKKSTNLERESRIWNLAREARNFWEIRPSDDRFPFRKSHFRIQIHQNFRLRRLNDTPPIPLKIWESDPQIIDFPKGNRISGFKFIKMFACGGYWYPTNSQCLKSPKSYLLSQS